MEFNFHIFPFNFTTTLALILSCIFFLVKGLKTSYSLNKRKKLPPSPWKLPLIGNMHQLAGALPHRAIRKLTEKYGPIIHLQLGEVSAIAVSTRDIAKKVLKDNEVASGNRPVNIGGEIMWYNFSDIAFSPIGEYWKQMRKLCIMELLSTKNIRSFGSVRLDEALKLMKSISSSSGETINLTDKIFSYNSSMTCRVIFGQILRDKDTLVKLMNDALALTGGFELADFFPSSRLLQIISFKKNKLWRMRSKFDIIMDSIINEHKDSLDRTKRGNGEFGGEDIVDVLIRLQKSGDLPIPITDDNIKAVILNLFSGATALTSIATDWAMAELIRNPHVMAKAQAEIRQVVGEKGNFEEADLEKLKYLKLVIKETLRVHPPAPLFSRESRDEFEVDGYTIPIKTKLVFNVWALARDPNYWDEPESFKPERFENNSIDFLGNNYELIPFGAGKRFCPGMNFSLASTELTLAQFLYYFNWKLPKGMNPNDIDMTEEGGLDVHRKNGLYVIPEPYKLLSDGN